MCEGDFGSWDALSVQTFIRVRIVVTLSQRNQDPPYVAIDALEKLIYEFTQSHRPSVLP
jgi:hypothetical protein